MLAGDQEALRDFFVGRESYGDSAAVIAVVRFGHDGESNAPRGTDGVRFTLDQFLLGDRQAEQAQNLVGFLLVAGQFDRNVRGAAGDRRLDALLVLAMTQLHQRLIIEPKPRNAAVFRGTYQGSRRGPERATLREADELIARLLPVPSVGHRAGRPDSR